VISFSLALIFYLCSLLASLSSLCSAAPAIAARIAIRYAGPTGLASVVIENYSAM
jgi:hypothetical protein